MLSLEDSSSDLSVEPRAISRCWLSMHQDSEGTQVASEFFLQKEAEAAHMINPKKTPKTAVLEGFLCKL